MTYLMDFDKKSSVKDMPIALLAEPFKGSTAAREGCDDGNELVVHLDDVY
jgi:hypothetical protein